MAGPGGTSARWPGGWPYAAGAEAAAVGSAVVATTDRYASEVGLSVLRQGGNAVDAAVAVGFALTVVNPEAGNVAGSGFMIVRTADGEVAALDHRSTAPRGATREMFWDEGGGVTERARLGALSVAVPGTVRGLWDAHARFGARPWEELVEPAVELARGFVVTERLARSFPPHIVEGLRRFPESARIFLPGGGPPRPGDTFRQPELAATLERIRDGGPDGFYRGRTADLIVAEMERGGGILTHEDLAAYETVWREPVRVEYRGHTLLSMPPPSSGGIALSAICRMLAPSRLSELRWHGAEHVHLLAETWRRVFADRNHYLADPAFEEMPLETLASPEYARWRAGGISPERATPSTEVDPGVEAWREEFRAGGPDATAAGLLDGPRTGLGPVRGEGEHTTHVSIVDGRGNAVSLTTTLNTWYGSKVVAEGTGVLLNNEMDDFTARAGVPNHFGLVQGMANAIEPGKRMLSAMTPTLVLDGGGRLAMVVGTPGGATIITTVFQLLSNVLDHGMGLADAVAAPRVHHQHLPDRIWYEPSGLGVEVVGALEAMGHDVAEREEPSGDVMAVAVDPGGTVRGQADPRRGGVALAL